MVTHYNYFKIISQIENQFAEINYVKSDTLILKTGLPQGSILGPLLCIIYINDIAHASQIFDFIIYANDTNISSALKIILKDSQNKLSIETIINNELKNISNWLKTNKLSLNVKKTKYIIFHTAKRNINTLNLWFGWDPIQGSHHQHPLTNWVLFK